MLQNSIKHAARGRVIRSRLDALADCARRTLTELPYNSFSSSSFPREYSTEAGPSKKTESIFTAPSPWEHLFENLDTPKSNLKPLGGLQTPNFQSGPRARRMNMTLREVKAFDEMFNMIFTAASSPESQSIVNRRITPQVGIGKTLSSSPSAALGELYSGLRGTRSLQWTSEEDQELDKMKEAMDTCDTDLELLEWAMREVFGESKRYEEEAKRAMEDPSISKESLQLQPASYPHLLAILMRTFRDKYSDPHLALSIFDYARHLSVPSYVFGCTTPSYNELIETRWRCFRDLRGVCDALEEMRVNGVEMDNRTRGLLEVIRSEVGARNLWDEESTLGSGEVWQMVNFLEKITARLSSRSGSTEKGASGEKQQRNKGWDKHQETWKASALDTSKDDDWVFGKWGDEAETSTSRETRPRRGVTPIKDLDFAEEEDLVNDFGMEEFPSAHRTGPSQ